MLLVLLFDFVDEFISVGVICFCLFWLFNELFVFVLLVFCLVFVGGGINEFWGVFGGVVMGIFVILLEFIVVRLGIWLVISGGLFNILVWVLDVWVIIEDVELDFVGDFGFGLIKDVVGGGDGVVNELVELWWWCWELFGKGEGGVSIEVGVGIGVFWFEIVVFWGFGGLSLFVYIVLSLFGRNDNVE